MAGFSRSSFCFLTEPVLLGGIAPIRAAPSSNQAPSDAFPGIVALAVNKSCLKQRTASRKDRSMSGCKFEMPKLCRYRSELTRNSEDDFLDGGNVTVVGTDILYSSNVQPLESLPVVHARLIEPPGKFK